VVEGIKFLKEKGLEKESIKYLYCPGAGAELQLGDGGISGG